MINQISLLGSELGRAQPYQLWYFFQKSTREIYCFLFSMKKIIKLYFAYSIKCRIWPTSKLFLICVVRVKDGKIAKALRISNEKLDSFCPIHQDICNMHPSTWTQFHASFYKGLKTCWYIGLTSWYKEAEAEVVPSSNLVNIRLS